MPGTSPTRRMQKADLRERSGLGGFGAIRNYWARRDRASDRPRASETAKRPDLERTSDPRCAPELSASPKSRAKARIYVPLLHAIRITASGRPMADVSDTLMRLDAEEGRDSLSETCAPPHTGRGRGPLNTSSRAAGTQEAMGGAGESEANGVPPVPTPIIQKRR